MKTALIVDDDGDNRALLGELLRMRGFDVLEAWDGLDALEQLQEQAPNIEVVILDLEMPILDGGSFRSHQLYYSALAQVPIIIVSGHPDAIELGRELAASAVLAKPISVQRMDEALAAVVG